MFCSRFVLMAGMQFYGTLNFNRFVRPCKQFSTRCAIQVNFKSLKRVFVCVNLPIDNQTNFVNEELHDSLDEIETFISFLNVDVILLDGDFNADFTRNNVQSNYVKAFCDRVNLPSMCIISLSFFYLYSQSEQIVFSYRSLYD